MFTVELKGFDDLLKNIEETKSKKYQLKALRSGAHIVADAIRMRAPFKLEDESWNPEKSTALPAGALKNDVQVVTLRKTDIPTVRVQFGRLTWHVARFVEFGHRMVLGKKYGKKEVGFVKPRPFFRPALDGSLAFAQTAIQASLSKSLQNVLKSGKDNG